MTRLALAFLLQLLSARALADEGCAADGACLGDDAETSALLQARVTGHSVNTSVNTTGLRDRLRDAASAAAGCPYHDGFDIEGQVCPFQYGDDATGAHCGDDGSGVSSDGWACYLYGSATHQGSVDLAAYVAATYGDGYCAKNPSGDKCIGWGVYGPGCGAC